jgi:anaerobic selenocysteine-containing dehydrogenase
MIRTLLDSDHPFLRGISLDELSRKHFVRLRVSSEGEPFLPFAAGGFGTASGKCEFRAGSLDYLPPVESRGGDAGLLAKYPLELISPKNDDSMNSTFGHREDVDRQTAVLRMHAEDAQARHVSNGDRVHVFNDRGSCFLTAEVNGKVGRGVVCAPSVRWPKGEPNGRNVNALASERLTDSGGGPTFYSCLVQVERIGD